MPKKLPLRRAEAALGVLADYEGEVGDALVNARHPRSALYDVCDALRNIIDEREKNVGTDTKGGG